MAGAVAQDKLLDFGMTTLAKVPSNEWHNLLIGQSYIAETFLKDLKPRDMTGKHVLFNAIIKGDAGDTGDVEDGGPGVYGPYEILPAGATEYQAQGQVPWSYYTGHWVLSAQEMALNKGREAYIDLLKTKKEGIGVRMANSIETHFWSRSGYAHESANKPWLLGPEYWLTDDGYHINDVGGTVGTVVGGISPTLAAYNDAAARNRWRNQFVQVTNAAEMVDGFDELFVDCGFQAPPSADLNTAPQFKRFKIAVDKTTLKDMKALRRRLKDNPFDVDNSGEPVLNNVKISFADAMLARADSKGQGFFFNLSTWRAYVEGGNNFRKGPIITPDNQDAKLQRLFFWPALVCNDRRSNGKAFGWGRLVKA